jgi:[ribosomal protein S5]-alanine N-acetyltransferase
MIFETSRLAIRYLVPEDFEDLFRMYSDPEMREYFPDGVRTADETREELEWFLGGDPRDPRLGLWAMVRKDDGKFVGRCGLLGWEIDGVKEIEIAYMVDKSFWRQGYGAEAARGLVQHGFACTDAPHLIALTDHRHTATIKTAEAAGLTFWKDIIEDGVASAVYKVDRPST